MRRKEECIGELKALGDCEGVAEIVRFMERMQLDDMDKCNHSLLLMREIEDKAREKSRLARQINALCDTLANVIDGRWTFVGELEMLAYKSIPGKMAEFMKEMHDKYIPNLMKLQILGRKFKLRARKKDLFIKKIKIAGQKGPSLLMFLVLANYEWGSVFVSGFEAAQQLGLER
ncbi:hypothetical protein Tco_0921105 [Tanacetum coccineum]